MDGLWPLLWPRRLFSTFDHHSCVCISSTCLLPYRITSFCRPLRPAPSPAQARALLRRVGGEVVHVYCEEGLRVSYRPYRETSQALMRYVPGHLPPGTVGGRGPR